jgi:putrescine aminotransferase
LLFDDTGKDYIDGLASLWYCQVGHGRPEMIDAITKQMQSLVTYNTFPPFTNSVAAEAADAVAAVSPMPDGRVFFGCSGSEAIDTALKLARLVQQRRGYPEKQIIIRRTRGYHGTNFGGTSAQGIAPNREGWGDLVPHFIEVPADDIEAAASVFAEHGDRVAAMLTEPLQGAGGVFQPPEGYLEGLRRLCDANGALLIHDEVINGFGRTGEWFGSQAYGVTPDLITFAKGVTSGYMPVSGVIIGRSVAAELEEQDELIRTGYTYSGHPTCMAAVLKNIELIKDENLVERAKHIGTRIISALDALVADGEIVSYDGRGAVWGVELDRDAVPVRDRMLELGVVMRPIYSRLAMCPPLVITDEEIGRMMDTMAQAIRETA